MIDLVVSDPENTEAADLQRKFEMLNNIMDQEARAEQARRQMQYIGHCEYPAPFFPQFRLIPSLFSLTVNTT